MGIQNFALVVPENQEALSSRADQIRRLQEMTSQLASDHVLALQAALAEVTLLASQIVESGDVFPVGIRQVAERLTEQAPWSAQTLEAIRGRTLRGAEVPEEAPSLALPRR
jgi:hypothetical protein